MGLPICIAALLGAPVELPVGAFEVVVVPALVDAGPVEVLFVFVDEDEDEDDESVALLRVVLRCITVPVPAELAPLATAPVPGSSVVLVTVAFFGAGVVVLWTGSGWRADVRVVVVEAEEDDDDEEIGTVVVATAAEPPLRVNMPL